MDVRDLGRRGGPLSAANVRVWLGLLWAAACVAPADGPADVRSTSDATADTAPPGVPPSRTTWHGDVRALTELHCAACHVDGGVAPFTFDDPDEVTVLGPAMVDAVRTGTMPPFGFRPDCREVDGDPSLDPATVATFEAWEADGFPLGDPADHVPPTATAPVTMRPPDLVARPVRPFTPDATIPDSYLCMVSELTFPEETFVTWSEVVPEHLEIAHHAIAYAVPPEQIDELVVLAGGDLSAQWTCFGGPVAGLGPMIGGWQPGLQPPPPDRETEAVRVPAGSRVVVEVHFNTVNGALPGVEDDTVVRLWTAPASQIEHLGVVWMINNHEIVIPAGEPRVEWSLTFRVPIEGRMSSTAPHMHLLGTELRTGLRRGSGAEECVSSVDYDFDWRRHYAFPADARPTFSSAAGDALTLTCVYDNSAENQPVVDGVRQEPREVVSGNGTFDEMCADYPMFQVPFDPTGSAGLCGGYDRCYAACDPEDASCPLVCLGNAGVACFACGRAAMFGPCTTRACSSQVAALKGCLDRCEHQTSDPFGCFVEECATPLAAYQACAQPRFADGSCAADYAGCSGLVP